MTEQDRDNALRAHIDAALDSAVADQRIVGGAVVVLRNGREVYARAVGLADREAGTPMQLSTVLRLSSLTKPIVALALLRLVEAGKLALDAPITRYLPDFTPKLADGTTPAISLQQLLVHTSGLSYGFDQPADGPYLKAGVSDGFDGIRISMDEELRRIVAAGLSFAPGTRWGYSVGLDVLGAAIERVTGSSLPEAIAELVTRPLEMRDSRFSVPADFPLATPYADGKPPVRMQEGQVVPFFDLSGLRYSIARAFDPNAFPSGGAGMVGTARDVVKVLELVRSGGGKLIRDTTARAMLTNHSGSHPVALGPGWGFGYGGAVLLDPAAAGTSLSPGSWSWGGVWGHSWFVDPARRLVLVTTTNTAIEGMMGQLPIDLQRAVGTALPL